MGGNCVDDDWELASSSNEVKTLVLVGRTGNGKSATGNSILGKKFFNSWRNPFCEMHTTTLNEGWIVNVIDTPGLFDNAMEFEFLSKEIVRCIDLAKDGIHAILLVFSVRNRLTDAEVTALHSLQTLFGSKIVDYMIVVFTGGDDLEYNDETLEDYLGSQCPEPLKDILSLCENRSVLFDNKTMDKKKQYVQIQQLLSHINMVILQNGGHPYTNELFTELKKGAMKLQNQLSAANLKGRSNRVISEMKMQMQLEHEEQLNQIVEKVKKSLAEEHAARLKAKDNPKTSQKSSDDQKRRFRKNLGRTREEFQKRGDSSPKEVRTVVLFGRSGNGKSATGNSILGEKVFESKVCSSGVTSSCKMQTSILNDGQIVNVIDTPGLFDNSTKFEFLGKEIVKCFDLANDGIHAILLVFSVRTRFTDEEETTIRSLQTLFGRKIVDYMIVVFTGGDELDVNDQTLEDYLGSKCSEPLKEVLSLCENRCALFDNRTTDEKKKNGQRQQLLSLVNKVTSQNGGQPYTNEYFTELKKNQQHAYHHELAREELLKRLVEMVVTDLREAMRRLEKQLEEEKAAKLEAKMKSEVEIRELRENLEKAQEEHGKRVDKSCVIL